MREKVPLWGHLGHPLGTFWALLGRSWALLGRSWALLGRSWALLGRSWDALGAPLDALGMLLGTSWAHLAKKHRWYTFGKWVLMWVSGPNGVPKTRQNRPRNKLTISTTFSIKMLLIFGGFLASKSIHFWCSPRRPVRTSLYDKFAFRLDGSTNFEQIARVQGQNQFQNRSKNVWTKTKVRTSSNRWFLLQKTFGN